MRLSLIIPVYNSRASIQSVLESALEHFSDHGDEFELLVVDDGSVDGTAAAMESVAGTHSALRLLRNEQNHGKGAAVRKGMLAARGERVVFTDADLAYPLSEVEKIVSALDAGADLAIASRVHRDSRFVMSPNFFHYLYTRHLASRLFNRLLNVSLRLAVQDSQAGLKGFRRPAAQWIFRRQELNGFTFDAEVLFLARCSGLNVCEVPVVYRYDSEPTTVDFVRDSVRALIDIWRIGRNHRRGRYREGFEGGA